MPVTLDTALNQDSIAFVEMVDRICKEISKDKFENFEVIDNSLDSNKDAYIIYTYRFYATEKVGVSISNSGENSVRLLIKGHNHLDATIFYSDKLDSINIKKC